MAGLQLGLSLLVWGVYVRTVLVWHITWSVNSIGHVWGYRNYETRENSRNSLLIGLISNGDGWHNNHHADQRAASHGHKWWELDVTHITLLVLKHCGLVWDLVPIGSSLVVQDDPASKLRKPSAHRSETTAGRAA
jgi:stearoyl-CoA desaturase (delta-9 desaturase)